MWTLDRIICMGMLAGLSVMDIRSRRLPVQWLAAGSLLAAGYRMTAGKGDFWLVSGGIAVGLMFLLISRVTGEGLGYGDGYVILILGIYLGLWELLTMLAGAFFLLAVFSIAGLTVKKMSRGLRIPFVPFLTAGYMMSILW